MENNINSTPTNDNIVDNKQVVKVNPNGSLMRKTKVQLVDIILRKDEVERQFNSIIDSQKKLIIEKDKSIALHKETIKQLNNNIDEAILALNNVNKQLDIFKNEYEETCDDMISTKVELNENKKRNRIIKFILIILLIISFICNYFLI